MAKLKELKGVTHNLLDSIVSPPNVDFILNMPKSGDGTVEIDLLEGKARPKDVEEKIRPKITYYKEWLAKEVKKLGIEPSQIRVANITVAVKRGKTSVYHSCKVNIEVKNGLSGEVRRFSSSTAIFKASGSYTSKDT